MGQVHGRFDKLSDHTKKAIRFWMAFGAENET